MPSPKSQHSDVIFRRPDSDLLLPLVLLIHKKAYKTGVFKLASGKASDYYLDCRAVTLSSEGAHLIGSAFCSSLANTEIDAIGGMSLGADPIVGATLALANLQRHKPLNGFLVRKKSKQHGTKQLVEGPVTSGNRVMIVEDVTTSGKSAMRAVKAIREIGCKVLGVISLIDRQEGASEYFHDKKIPFFSILTIDDLKIR